MVAAGAPVPQALAPDSMTDERAVLAQARRVVEGDSKSIHHRYRLTTAVFVEHGAMPEVLPIMFDWVWSPLAPPEQAHAQLVLDCVNDILLELHPEARWCDECACLSRIPAGAAATTVDATTGLRLAATPARTRTATRHHRAAHAKDCMLPGQRVCGHGLHHPADGRLQRRCVTRHPRRRSGRRSRPGSRATTRRRRRSCAWPT